MVARLVGLKLLLLRNGLRRSPWQVVALVLGLLWGLGVVVLLGAGLVALRFAGVDVARPVVVGAGALAVLGWALVPLVAFGVDETLDPARFATFGVPRRRLVPGLLLAGLIGGPGVVTLLLALTTAVTWGTSPGAVLVALVAALLATLTCVAASRATTTAAAGVLRSRRTRDVLLVVGGLLLISTGPGINVLIARAGDLAALAGAVVDVVAWTPLGYPWAAGADAAQGRWGTALLRLLLAAATLALLLLGWGAALGAAGGGPTGGSSRAAAATAGRGLADRLVARLPAVPAVAVAHRCLVYWRRDPRYLISTASLLVVPLLLVVIPLAQGGDVGAWLLAAGPAVAFLTGWSLHDDVAYDHSAFALHVSAGVRGRDDRAGRALAAGCWQLPVVVLLAVVPAAAGGRWALLPAVLGLSLALYGAGLGVSCVSSALAPYPAAPPGGNPFQTPRGAAAATLVAQLVTTLVTAVVALPTAAAAVATLLGVTWAGWLALLLGAATGALAVRTGIVQGGRVLDRRAPEVLATVSRS
ncbi:hypothetical protein [Kineococcus sp. SYSU DK004]|uniref:hypothetical protein n=1 Tax=Kineococcus sp. SYSU DK004 TaxID=3383125 RepID=UPI003D7DD6DC